MTAGARIPARLVIGLAVAIALDTGLQLVWKTGIAGLPDAASASELLVAIALNPIFVLVAVFMLAQLVNWLKVLDHADLSYAKPFTSLSYVTVCVLSVLLLGEHIAPLQIVGIVVVVAGVWCVSQTRRAPPAQVPPIDGSGAEPE
jgi:drug/metabolite transporter (DMT)-like permease